MPDFSIDQIIAGGKDAGTTADFSGVPKILDSYYKSRDEAAKNDQRTLFKDGVPTTPDGQPDFAAMGKALFQTGAFDQGVQASNLDISRQQLKMGQQAADAMGRAESPQTPQPQIISPPSINRSGSTPVAPALAKGGAPAGQGSPQAAPQGATLPQILAAQGIPNDQIGAAAASVGRQLGLQDPNQPLDLQDPQVRNVLVPAIQQLKRMGIGQVQPPPDQPQAQPQQQPVPQVAQAQAQGAPNPQQNQGTFGAPSAVATRGALPTGADPEIQKQIAVYTSIASNPAYPKSVQEAAIARLKALQDQGQPTGPMKEYDLYRRQGGDLPFNEWIADTEARKARATETEKLTGTQKEYLQAQGQGYKGTLQDYIRDQKTNEPTGPQKEFLQAKKEGYTGSLQDFMADNEAKKTVATEEAKLNATKYATLVDAGVKAQQELPQLEMLQKEMENPNFYSGVGEKYNLLYKRLQSATGIDKDAAVPQEFLRKATAASVLASFGALKGLGPIRVAEMNLAKQAAAAPENSVPANKLLVEIQKRTYQRQGDIAEMAQNYKEQNGSLDAGFDKQVTSYFKAHPIFSDAEVQDFHKAIGEAPARSSGAKFSSPADVHAAVAAGTLKKGDTFTDPNGVKRIVP